MTKEEKESKVVKPIKVEKEPQLEDISGVGPGTVEKLHDAGMVDVASVAVTNIKYLADTAGISETLARKIQKEANKMFNLNFMTITEVEEKDSKKKLIPIGASDFDNLIGGGVETQAITEVAGKFSMGKSQLAHILAVQCIIQNPKDYVAYIDTENTFKTSRIEQIAKDKGIDPEIIKKKLFVLRASSSDIQMFAVQRKLPELILAKKNVRLVILDSLTALFRCEFQGRGSLADRQQKLNGHMRDLKNFADKYNAAIFVTNQVMSNPAQMYGDPDKPIGGNIVSHSSSLRIFLRQGQKGTRVAKLYDSTHLPDGECQFEIVEGGIINVK